VTGLALRHRIPGQAGRLRVLVACLFVTPLLASCSAISSSAAKAPVLDVVTGLYPLAEAVSQIGQSKVTVVDIVPAASNPRTYQPTAADKSLMNNAGLVLEVGGGLQPPFEAAATASSHVLALGGAPPSGPYPWVDPAGMDAYVNRIESAMAAADPEASSLFKAGAQAFEAEVDSTGIDYQNTLAVCPRTTIFTADDAFSAMAAAYGLHDVVVGTSPLSQSAVSALSAQVHTSGAGDVFEEPWAGAAAVRAVAAVTDVGVRTLDTLVGASAGGTTYIQLLEANLSQLNDALACGGNLPNR
jgi:ABC-type Zn uptake system ZnuABC Zn-binding protein ZnuA